MFLSRSSFGGVNCAAGIATSNALDARNDRPEARPVFPRSLLNLPHLPAGCSLKSRNFARSTWCMGCNRSGHTGCVPSILEARYEAPTLRCTPSALRAPRGPRRRSGDRPVEDRHSVSQACEGHPSGRASSQVTGGPLPRSRTALVPSATSGSRLPSSITTAQSCSLPNLMQAGSASSPGLIQWWTRSSPSVIRSWDLW